VSECECKCWQYMCDACQGHVLQRPRARIAELKQELQQASEQSASHEAAATALRSANTANLERIRIAAQILITEIGAPGPENIEDTADRAIAVIRQARERIAALESAVKSCATPIKRANEPRKYAPLPADHHAVTQKQSCWYCGVAFQAGDETTLLPQRRIEDNLWEGALTHWACYEAGRR
jgi:lipopolysaccharide biosynthesis regulator YciM